MLVSLRNIEEGTLYIEANYALKLNDNDVNVLSPFSFLTKANIHDHETLACRSEILYTDSRPCNDASWTLSAQSHIDT